MPKHQISTTVSASIRALFEDLCASYGGGRGAGRAVLTDALRLLAEQRGLELPGKNGEKEK